MMHGSTLGCLVVPANFTYSQEQKSVLFTVFSSLFSNKLLNSKESKQQPGMRERVALLHALWHWQPYLIGREFTLRTHHDPNLALAKGKMKSYDTLTDYILQLMPFKMDFMNGN